MYLNHEQMLTFRYIARDVIIRRRLGNASAPPQVHALHRDIEAALSARGHESDTAKPQLVEDDLIGTTEAARILGCTPRHVRRIHADLDGKRCGRDWVFQHRKVIEYARQKGI